MSSGNSSQSSSPSGSFFSPANENSGPHEPYYDSGARTTPSIGRPVNSLQLDHRSLHFSVNAWVLAIATLGIVPVLPNHLSKKAYRLSLIGTSCSSLYSLYYLYGIPRYLNLRVVQAWFQTIVPTKDFIRLIYCLIFVNSKLHIKSVLIPVLCWAMEQVAKFLKHNFSGSSLYRVYLERPCSLVEANTTVLSFVSSNAEIMLGFLLILSLLSWHRSVMQVFMYWQLLKLMYHAPPTASFHQNRWTIIGRNVNPLIYRHAPFLGRPLSAFLRWWFR